VNIFLVPAQLSQVVLDKRPLNGCCAVAGDGSCQITVDEATYEAEM